MKNDNYVDSLLPVISKSKILEDLRVTSGELTNFTIKAYEDWAPTLRGYKYQTPEVQNLVESYPRNLKISVGSEGFIGSILKNLKQLQENLLMVEEQIDGSFPEEVTKTAISYQQANMLQYVDVASFLTKYARRLLIYIATYESASLAMKVSDGGLSEEIAQQRKVERDFITENWMDFCQALGAMCISTKEAKDLFETVPEIMVTGNGNSLAATVGIKKLDPFRFGFISVRSNIIYKVRMIIARWQADRYKAAKEELRMLEMRRLHFERLKGGKNDARLEREIGQIDQQMSDVNYQIAKMEKSYGL